LDKTLLYLLILFSPICLIGQISIEPNINYSYARFTVDDSARNIEIENNNGALYGLGISINANLFNNLQLSLHSQWTQALNKGIYKDLDFQGHILFYPNLYCIKAIKWF